VSGGLTRVAVYERTLPVSLERIWENVHDWEHLPFVHAGSFCEIALETSGPWGWRARVKVPPRESPRELLIELRREEHAERYHTRTLEGFGTGADIITSLDPRGDRETAMRVEFWLPEPEPGRAAALGEAMVGLYSGLWDEDEAMMVRRQAFLDGRAAGDSSRQKSGAIPLGTPDAVRARAPFTTEVGGQQVRVALHGDRLVAHTLVCPHLGGPLDEGELRDGHVVCPWHGYRFSLEDGSNPDGRRCRLASPARVTTDAAGGLHLEIG